MYDELVQELRYLAKVYSICQNENTQEYRLAVKAADAIEHLVHIVMELENELGIYDELPMVDQTTPCDTCAHKGNVDFDYCHICNNEADMYKPKPPKEET